MSPDGLLGQLTRIVSRGEERVVALQRVADLLKSSGGYRWVGLYEIDHAAQVVRNVVWSGPGAPEYPVFPIDKGLTGAAIARRETVNVGDVAADPRYLTAFGTTRSEMIVPVFDETGENVAGTIDIESETPHAFGADAQALMERCAAVIRPLWRRNTD
jgi:L-methionine (R)-S-oxide reductase